jgi:nucleoid DNA-binding protein
LDITSFIRDLILLNECVILRGFGGFDTSYKHAIFDKYRKTIVPPSKKITFRADWIKDNGVLEKYIAESLKIKPEKASEYISSYVENINKRLNEEGLLLLEGVGKFQKTEGKKIKFTSIEDENYLADSFGLDMLEVEIEQVRIADAVPTELKPVITGRRRLTGWYVAIGILLLFILITTFILLSGKSGISLLGFFNKNTNKSTETEVVIFGKQSKTLEDSVIRSIEQTLDKNTSAKNALSLIEEKKTAKIEPGITYLLVAGSFKSAKNADVLKEKLIKKGYNPTIMGAGNNFTMVIVGTFNSKVQASEELTRVRKQLGPSVWLMEK